MRALFRNRHVVRGTLAASVLAGLFGVNATLNGNQPVPLPDGVVVFGAEEVAVQKDTNILSGDLVSNGEVELDRDVFVEGSVIGDEVEIERGVRILGNLEANEIEAEDDEDDDDANGTFIVEGETITPRETPNFAIPELPPVNPGTQNIRIKKGEEATINPGNYHEIKIENEAKVTLQPGDYHLRSLRVGNGAVLTFTDPTTLHIKAQAIIGDHAVFNLAPNLDVNDIRINFHGHSFVIGSNAFAAGVIHAPNALVFIHKDSVWRGQIAAKKVGIGKETTISREVAFTKLSDPSRIVENPSGGQIVVNEILVDLQDGVAPSLLDPILRAIGGRIVGVSELLNEYKIEVAATTFAELAAKIAAAQDLATAGVESITANHIIIDL